MFWNTFNSSIWNALWVLLPLGIVAYLRCFLRLKKGCHYFFDPKHDLDPRPGDAGDYEPHSKRYQDLAKLAITLSAAAIAFLINTIITSDGSVTSAFAQRVQAAAPIVVAFFGSCIPFLVLFMVSQALWYEQYCHSHDHSSYKGWKYALSTSMGWTGLISLVLGFLWLACNLFPS